MNNDKRVALALDNLTIGYKIGRHKFHRVARDLNAALNSGELVCLLGPNGAGKSTLMRTLAGMQKTLGGKALLGGKPIHDIPARELAKKLSVVLTERVTIGALSAYALVALGRYPYTNWTGTLSENDHRVVAEALETVSAADLAHRSVSELSDGERQKVMVARALAQEPEIMLLDEITAFLDLPRRVGIMRMLRDMTRTTGKAVLLSTHDLDLAIRTADRLWLLSKDGSFQTGVPEDLVLSGAFERVFADEGVEFERAEGHFKLHRNFIGKVDLTGNGLPAVWTRRALERFGYEIVTDSQPHDFAVEVVHDLDETRWKLPARSNNREFTSLQELLEAVRAMDPEGSDAD